MADRSVAAQKAWKTRWKKARILHKRAKKAWDTRLTNWEELRRSVLLIEGMSEEKIGCSEGKMLKELFRIIDIQMKDNNETVAWNKEEVTTPEKLLSVLRKANQSCIHISCHGAYFKNYKKTGFKLPKGRLFSEEISSAKNEALPIWHERVNKESSIPQLVFLSACETAHEKDMVERFMQAGVRYVIAPKNETPFSDAALFSSIFYPLVYVEQKNPYIAFKKIKRAFPKMTGNWRFFDLYKHDFKIYDPNGVGKL